MSAIELVKRKIASLEATVRGTVIGIQTLVGLAIMPFSVPGAP